MAGGVIRNYQSVHVTNVVATAMRTCSSCKRRNFTTDAVTPEPACDSCAQYLLSQGRKAEEFVSSVGQLAGALSEAGVIEKGNQFRYLSSVSADIIDKAVKSGDCYHAEFSAKQEEDVLLCNTLHRNGMGLGVPANEHWFVEEQRTGEFFVGDHKYAPGWILGQQRRRKIAANPRKIILVRIAIPREFLRFSVFACIPS